MADDRVLAGPKSATQAHGDHTISVRTMTPSEDADESDIWALSEPVAGPSDAGGVEQGYAPLGVGEGLLHRQPSRASSRTNKETTPLLGRRRGSRSRSPASDRPTKLPWYRTPSPAWLLPGAFIMAVAYAMTIAPKLEVYNQLVCRALGDAGAAPSGSAPDDSNTTAPFIPPASPSPHLNTTRFAFISTFDDVLLGPAPRWPWDTVLPDIGDNSTSTPETAEEQAARRAAELKALNEWADACRRSPKVSSAVAKLNTALVLTSGILGSLTGGFWGGVSDRRGRRLIITLGMLGFLFNDFVFLATVLWHRVLPYWFLIAGPLVEGLLGGFATAQAAVTAYTSDCTPSGSRARIFSTFFGMFMAGMALGPTFGGLSVKLAGTVLAPFYISAIGHLAFALFASVIMPESLSEVQAAEAASKDVERRVKRADFEAHEDRLADLEAWSIPRRLIMIRAKRLLITVFGFLRPVGLLLPKKGGLEGVEVTSRDPKAVNKRDWNLTIVALAYSLYTMSFGVYGVKMQYAVYQFDWGPLENGWYLSLMGASRVVALLIVLPLVLRFVKPKHPAPARPATQPQEPSEPVMQGYGSGDGRNAAEAEEEERRERHIKILHDSHFDLSLARYSMLVDMLAYVALVFNTSPATFLVPSLLQALGGGASPAMQSLALSLVPPHHSGKVLASLSVLQSLLSSVVGPLVFGLLYASTVATYPKMIFLVCAAVFGSSFACLLLIGLKKKQSSEEAPDQPTTSDRSSSSVPQ